MCHVPKQQPFHDVQRPAIITAHGGVNCLRTFHQSRRLVSFLSPKTTHVPCSLTKVPFDLFTFILPFSPLVLTQEYLRSAFKT